jgi:hypothetical protein
MLSGPDGEVGACGTQSDTALSDMAGWLMLGGNDAA